MKKYKLYVSIIICSIILLGSCKREPKKVIKTQTISFVKEGNLNIYKAETDSVLVNMDIEIAESDYETETGLMYRKGMEENQGMLFIMDVREHFFHMKNTEFALDIIFIDENLKIASFQENAQPFNEQLLPSQVPAKYALEINAGLSEKWLLEVGDRVEFNKM